MFEEEEKEKINILGLVPGQYIPSFMYFPASSFRATHTFFFLFFFWVIKEEEWRGLESEKEKKKKRGVNRNFVVFLYIYI